MALFGLATTGKGRGETSGVKALTPDIQVFAIFTTCTGVLKVNKNTF